MAAIGVTVSQSSGDDPFVVTAYLPTAKVRVVEATRAVLPVFEPHNLIAALVQFDGGRQQLDIFAQIVFDLGRRYEIIELQKRAEKQKKRRKR